MGNMGNIVTKCCINIVIDNDINCICNQNKDAKLWEALTFAPLLLYSLHS